MIIQQFFTPGLAVISYMIFDEASRRCAVIDPTRHIEQYLGYAKQENVSITHILETHVHADFVSGAKELKAALQEQPAIVCSGMGGQSWAPLYADQLIEDRQEISLGSVRLQAWHTPGHTPEHIIWVGYDDQRNAHVPAVAFTGDLLFVGSVGRPDLLGKQEQEVLTKQLYHTLFDTLAPLPDFIEIYPAHGAGSMCGKAIGVRRSSTLGYERQCNLWLKEMPYEKWSLGLLKEIPPAPSYFKEMKRVNVSGIDAALMQQQLPPVITMEQVLALMATCQIVDVRNPDVFSLGHLKNAINIPLSPSFTTWAGSTLPLNKDLIVIVGDISEALFVVQSLKLIGMSRIKGVCSITASSVQQWPELFYPASRMSVENVYSNKDATFLLDVRTLGEWQANHIPEAHHIEMSQVAAALDQLPKNVPIAVFCHSGMRASVIASLLQEAGFAQAACVRGGMQAWIKAGLPHV